MANAQAFYTAGAGDVQVFEEAVYSLKHGKQQSVVVKKVRINDDNVEAADQVCRAPPASFVRPSWHGACMPAGCCMNGTCSNMQRIPCTQVLQATLVS